MSTQPLLGTIKLFGGNFAPLGYAFCNGQLLAISQNSALFALIGTTYGGDGSTTFALPDMRGRLPLHQGQGTGLSNYVLGQAAGTESVTLISQQLPIHTHPAGASTSATQTGPGNGIWATSSLNQFVPGPANQVMNANSILPAGNSAPHENRMPYLCISFIIALEGIFPSRN